MTSISKDSIDPLELNNFYISSVFDSNDYIALGHGYHRTTFYIHKSELRSAINHLTSILEDQGNE